MHLHFFIKEIVKKRILGGSPLAKLAVAGAATSMSVAVLCNDGGISASTPGGPWATICLPGFAVEVVATKNSFAALCGLATIYTIAIANNKT